MYKRISSTITLVIIIIFVLSTKTSMANTDKIGVCAEIQDPYESFNRKVFAVNKTLDHTILRPPILLYLDVVPKWPRYRINSFFSNLTSPLTLLNNILQGNFEAAGKTFGRFLFNSTAGIGGLIDWSKACGLEDKPQLFEDTLMKFGAPYGQYIVLPFLGPSTTRGTAGKIVDTFTDPVNLLLIKHKNNSSLIYFAARKFDQRAQAEEILDLSKQNLLDEYSFIRSSYLQYIASQNPFCKNQQDIDYDAYD